MTSKGDMVAGLYADSSVYVDSDGRRCDLATMCCREPGWAASRITALLQERARMAGEIRALESACDVADITRLSALCDAGTWAATATTREGDSRDGYSIDLAAALLQAVERVTAMRMDRAYADGRDDAELAALAARGVL